MKLDTQAAFDKFLADNPSAWELFCKLANNLWDKGVRHYGSKGIIETMRYHSAIDARPESKYKINNCWTPLFARKYLESYPDRKDFFSLRELKPAA